MPCDEARPHHTHRLAAWWRCWAGRAPRRAAPSDEYLAHECHAIGERWRGADPAYRLLGAQRGVWRYLSCDPAGGWAKRKRCAQHAHMWGCHCATPDPRQRSGSPTGGLDTGMAWHGDAAAPSTRWHSRRRGGWPGSAIARLASVRHSRAKLVGSRRRRVCVTSAVLCLCHVASWRRRRSSPIAATSGGPAAARVVSKSARAPPPPSRRGHLNPANAPHSRLKCRLACLLLCHASV